MELRAFAERVLFATSLEEKLLAPPDGLSDDQPGPPIAAAPAAPGRPRELAFKPAGARGRADFPDVRRLEQERERGRLLHFFANHELLATELMALVLLRFPEAPAAFRRGVLRTLADEQQHTRWYLARMRACGIAFGELPVSGYFWRCVAPMENPINYVAGLSLTFEQANLDFAQHFARGFAAVGDDDTARLLEKIHRDEIGHVAYGLKWFRRWKNPGESDWDAFCRQLKFPLSPQRAKGFSFNAAGRRAAGLDDAFITRLDVFAQSKGRTPGVFVFNPFAEGFIARGPGFAPTARQRQLAEDLATLPQFLARQDDIVLVPRRPRVEFLRELQQAGFALPEFVDLPGGAIPPGDPVSQRKLGRLRPWAWGPDSIDLLAPLFASVTGEACHAEQCFNPAIAELYSKAWSAAFLRDLLCAHEGEDWLSSPHDAGVMVQTRDQALTTISEIRARGHHRVVVKETFGLAGRNALRLWEPTLTDAQLRWIDRACAAGRILVVEPWLERVLDFSVQLEMTPRRLELCGFTGLINDARGQFQANWAAPNFARRPPAAVAAALAGPPDIAPRLHQLYIEIRERLERALQRTSFRGPIGIDAFVHREASGAVRLKPVVEINPRYTMGRVMVELMQHVTPGSFGCFRLLNLSQIHAAGCDGFPAYARRIRASRPLHLAGEPRPRIHEGAVILTDPAQAQASLAILQVARTWADATAVI